jgi:hypothetical protein
MNEELREKALSKMLTEMNEKHSPAIDRIHNWLCDQDDEELYQGIMKDGKTIHGGFAFAKSKAQKEAKDGVACIEDETVFGWIRDYFTTETPVVPAKTEEMQEADQKGMEERVAETKKAREEAKVKQKRMRRRKPKLMQRTKQNGIS